MPRGGEHQVAEAAEDVGTDRLPLVGGQHPPHRALLGVHVEVVEPEVDQHFLELALAQHRPRDPRRLHLGRDHRGAALRRVHLDHRLTAHLPGGELLAHLRRGLRVLAHEIRRAPREHRVGQQGLVDRGVGEAARTELLVDVGGDADAPHPLHVTRPGPVAQPVQRVEDLLVGSERRHRQREAARSARRGVDRRRTGRRGRSRGRGRCRGAGGGLDGHHDRQHSPPPMAHPALPRSRRLPVS